MENCCLNCKYFKIWDGDPCCLEKDEFKIVLPTMTCHKHEEETFKPVLQLHKEMWEECKEEFFERYSMSDENLKKTYLKMFPEDKELINKK